MAKVAVIDLGKSNSKLALVDTESLQELQVFTTPSTVRDAGLYPHLDVQHIESFLLDSLARLATVSKLDAITVTTHGATAALLNADGSLALPVMDYEYLAIEEQREAYDLVRPLFSETGSPALPGGLNLGAQLYWQQQQYPQAFAHADALLTWPQYWVNWLSGACINDVTSLGCHTDLYAPMRGEVSSLFTRTDWGRLMPAIKHSGDTAAPIKTDLAKLVGLDKTLPVHVGIHDSNASLVPYLKACDGAFSVLSTGTWFIAMAIGGKKVTLDERRDTLLNVNAMGAAVPSARFMGGRERQELLATCSDQVLDEQLIDGLVAELLDKSVFIMPSRVKGTGPYPDAEGEWLGDATALSDQAKICAVALYLALMSAECLSLIGADGPSCIEGPLSHDRLFSETLSVASRRAVFVSESVTGTSVGAAMLVADSKSMELSMPANPEGCRHQLLSRYAQRWSEALAVRTASSS